MKECLLNQGVRIQINNTYSFSYGQFDLTKNNLPNNIPKIIINYSLKYLGKGRINDI